MATRPPNGRPNPVPNSKPFPKGVSGNPKGRPKKLPDLDKLLIDILSELSPSGITAAEAILKAIRKKAVKGDLRAGEVLLDRAYGKPKETIDVNKEYVFVIESSKQKPA